MITYTGKVHPGQCDMNGHMNVVYYTQIFDGACWELLGRLTKGEAAQNGLGWADVTHTTEFLREMHVGEQWEVHSEVGRIGNKSLTTIHTLKLADDATECARITIVSVRLDLQSRKSVPIEPTIRENALSD